MAFPGWTCTSKFESDINLDPRTLPTEDILPNGLLQAVSLGVSLNS
jgi:hypothetical protein